MDKMNELEGYIKEKDNLEHDLRTLENDICLLRNKIKMLDKKIFELSTDEDNITGYRNIVIYLHRDKLFIKTGFFHGNGLFTADSNKYCFMTKVPTISKSIYHNKVLCHYVNDIPYGINLLLGDKRPGNYSLVELYDIYNRACKQFTKLNNIDVSIPIWKLGNNPDASTFIHIPSGDLSSEFDKLKLKGVV